MRCELIAECATNHGGDLDLAEDMIRAAADNGADWVKFQSYQVKHLKPSDPQYDWLKQCELSDAAHERLMTACVKAGVKFLTTVFHEDDLRRVLQCGVTSVKVGSGEAADEWWRSDPTVRFVSWPWGLRRVQPHPHRIDLAAIPLYPTPLEVVRMTELLNGWSDHTEGMEVVKYMIARGVQVVEKHFGFRDRGRWQAWNMDPTQLRELRAWAETMAVIRSGNPYAGRWAHSATASATD